MNSKKKLLAGALSLAFSLSPFAAISSYATSLPEDVAGTGFEEPVQILAALKIMVGDDDGAFRLGDNIKRSEVAKMAIHALGLEDAADAAKGDSKFPDVSLNHWANGYINLATAQGLIVGDDEGNFRPDDSISYAETVAIFVRALGYEIMAENKGGYPNGYMSVATSNGMTKNVQGSQNKAITRGNVAFLTNNSLTVNMMEQKGFGANATYEVSEKTLLKDKLNTTKESGQITAIPTTSLEGESNLDKGEVKIGDNIYNTAYNLNNLFGYNVVYYLKSDDSSEEKIILALPQKDQNSTLTISADLFEGLTVKNEKKAVEYFEKAESKKTSTATLAENAKLIYNGKATELTDKRLDISDKSGKMELLDSDRDGSYDIVFVTEYYNIVVDEVTASGKITDKFGAPTLKLGDDEKVSYRILRGLQEIEISELKEYDVLSVAKSLDGELYDIVVSNATVNGKVSGKDADGFYIDGNHYKVAKNYTETISIGTQGVFYLDIEGKIAAIDQKVSVSDNYGYLIKAYSSNETEKATFKIFTKEGAEKTFTANDKIKFNGISGKKSTEVVSELSRDGSTLKQLLTYTVNAAGNISEISTYTDNTATGKANADKFTLDYIIKDAQYNQKLQKLGNIRLTEETKIFDIQDDTSDYSIAALNMFEDKQKYDIMVFDTTEEFTAKAIIVTNAEFNTNAEATIAIVSKISSSINSDDEVTDTLHALHDGKNVELMAEEAGILVKGEENKKLETGDIIQYKTNEKGEIVKIRVLFDVNEKAVEKNETPVDDLEIIYGKVAKKFSGSVNVTVNDGKVRNIVIPSDAVIYSVDTTKTKNNITVATSGDIQAYDEDENNRVFIRLYDEVVKEIVIIK